MPSRAILQHRRARGQALILALFLALVGALAWLQLYQRGQLVHEKNRLTHAVDAAVYTGALIQARALNLLALANRAQVAHQVALAHLVTLDTWALFGQHESERVTRGNPPAYLIGMLFGPAHGEAYAAAALAGSMAQLRGQLAAAVAAHDAAAHDVLWRAQLAVLHTLPAARADAMQATLAANFDSPDVTPEVHLDPDALFDDLPGALHAAKGSQAHSLRDLALQAVAEYGFLAERNFDARNAWVVNPKCPGLRHQLRRRGHTRLDVQDVWRSSDTQAYHAVRSNRWIGCYFREYPLGWGEAVAGHGSDSDLMHVKNPPDDFANEAFWRWAQRQSGLDILWGNGNPLANSWAVAAQARHGSRGLGGVVEINAESAARPLRLAFRAIRPFSSLRLHQAASAVRFGDAGLAPVAQLPDDSMAAVAAAEVHFEAMPGVVESPGLFTPGWQARLVPASSQELNEARRRQGVS